MLSENLHPEGFYCLLIYHSSSLVSVCCLFSLRKTTLSRLINSVDCLSTKNLDMGLSNLLLVLVAFLAPSSHALKCYVGTSASKTATECPSSSQQCVSVEVAGVTTYSCGTSGLTLGCNTVAGTKTCACDYNLCILESTNTGTGFQCYVNNIGPTFAEPTEPVATDCTSDTQQCATITKDGKTYYDCGPPQSDIEPLGCKTTDIDEHKNVEICICYGQLCNFIGRNSALQLHGMPLEIIILFTTFLLS